MGTDFTIFTAEGYCMPEDIFNALIERLYERNQEERKKKKKKKKTVKQWHELDWEEAHLMIKDQDNYPQAEQFNKMVFFYCEETKEEIFSGKIGPAMLLHCCPIRQENAWGDSSLYGGARLPQVIRIECDLEECDFVTHMTKVEDPLIKQIGEEIIKTCEEWKGKWLFSYFH